MSKERGGHNKALIVSKAKETGAKSKSGLLVIAYRKEHFRYPEGLGVLMLDHDKARANSAAQQHPAAPASTVSIKQHTFYHIKGFHFTI